MTPAEASRIFQCAVEAERRCRTVFEGTVSGEDEIAATALEREHAREQLIDALVAHETRNLI